MIKAMNDFMENKFLQIVYEYYPVGIESGTLDYRNSKEFIKLYNLIKNADVENEDTRKLKLFLSHFVKKGENFCVQDYTLLVSLDRCYNIQLIKDNFKQHISHSICVNISLLIPYYTIHVLEIRRGEDHSKWISSPERKVELETKTYKNVIGEIKDYLNSELNLNEFPEELIYKVIPNIHFENARFGKFTFYNAFFINEFYTR